MPYSHNCSILYTVRYRQMAFLSTSNNSLPPSLFSQSIGLMTLYLRRNLSCLILILLEFTLVTSLVISSSKETSCCKCSVPSVQTIVSKKESNLGGMCHTQRLILCMHISARNYDSSLACHCSYVYRNNSRYSLPRVILILKKLILPASDIGQACIPFRCLHNIFEYRHWWTYVW